MSSPKRRRQACRAVCGVAAGRAMLERMVRHLRRRSYALSDIGKRREGNEDAFIADDTLGLYVVADGVGGQAKGEVASSESVDQVRNFVRNSYETIEAYFCA